jgi:hypothetical protein
VVAALGKHLIKSVHRFRETLPGISIVRMANHTRLRATASQICFFEISITLHRVRRLMSRRHTAVGDFADFQDASDEHT